MFRLDPRHHYEVRCALLIALLVAPALCACGKKDDKVGGSQHAENEDEDPCDPSESKVCVGNSVTSCEKNGHIGRRLRTCKDGCRDGRCAGACSDEANKLIYLVDNSNNFLSFDPRKLPGDPFKLIGQLDCPTYGTPFSMSVDREGIAWIVYQSGELMKVSITDAKCKASGFVPGSTSSRTFGMGFATDVAGGKTEKLYTANDDGSRSLAWIDTSKQPPMAHSVGPINTDRFDRNPELTGTSEGKLFGFYPNEHVPAFVQEIDKTSGTGVGPKWNLGDQGLGEVSAWAFAQWGGVFYIFVTTNGTPTVRSVDRKGNYHMLMDMTPYKVTGAGVSTCAPELDKAQQDPTP